MSIKKWGALLIISSIVMFASGCGAFQSGTNSNTDQKTLKYRVLPTASSDLFETGIKPILEKEGYKLEPVKITDAVQREMALDEGQIDFHVDAHKAYLDTFNKQKGTHLAAVLPIPTVPMGIYSGRKTSLDSLQDGDTIAIPNDASNVARAYQLLSHLGWIQLDPSKDVNQVTQNDIISNPKNLKFQEMRGPSIASVRTDVDYIILRGSDAYNAQVDFDTALFAENQKDISADMVMALCVNEKNRDAKWVQDIIAAYHSPEFKQFMSKQSHFWILPDYLQ